MSDCDKSENVSAFVPQQSFRMGRSITITFCYSEIQIQTWNHSAAILVRRAYAPARREHREITGTARAPARAFKNKIKLKQRHLCTCV